MSRPIPARAKALIKSFEACKLTAYRDVKGVWTIGWGNTRHAQPGLRIKQAQADAWFDEDCQGVEIDIARILKPAILAKLTEDQYGALACFAFNLGVRPKAHAIWALVNSGRFDEVPGRLLKYNKAAIDGKLVAVAGLTRRRRAEAALWQEDGDEVVLTARAADVQPVQTEKPLAQSKTMWAGGSIIAAGVVDQAAKIQAIAAPQAASSDLVARLVSFLGLAIVAAGVAVMVFRYLDSRKRRA